MNTSFLPRLALATALSLASASAAVAADRTPSPAGAEVYIVSPKDGAKVKSPVTVVFGLKGMGIAPGRHQVRQHRPPPPAHRQRSARGPVAAVARERENRALRQGPDRNHADAAAGQTHPAARARRLPARAARSGGDLEEGHHLRRRNRPSHGQARGRSKRRRMTAPRAILHVDMDAFYASVEQRDRPELRGQPLIVGGTTNRGVVAAASYEVRKFGVRSAMPIREALRRCPHAICVTPRMSVYREVSHQVFAIFHEYTPVVEGLSLDEAFLDVTASLALKGDAVSIARGIKQTDSRGHAARAPRSASRPTSSWRRSPPTSRSPTGSPWSRPTTCTRCSIRSRCAACPGSDASSASASRPRASRRSASCARAPDAVLWPIFGRDSQRMRERAAGIDERPVMAEWDEKSISAEETFFSDLADARACRPKCCGSPIAPARACARRISPPAACR